MLNIKNIYDNIIKKIRHQNYDENNFVGREKEIKDTISFFKSHFNKDSNTDIPIVVYHGDGGIGKTFLCKKISKEIDEKRMVSSGIIDLKETNNRSIISIIIYISKNLTDNGFKVVGEQIKNYENTKDIDKLKFAEQIEISFFEAIKNFSLSIPLIVIVENLQTIKGTSFWQLFLSFMKKCKGKCGFILAGHEDITFTNLNIKKKSFKIIPFLAHELKEYAISRQKSAKRTIKGLDNITTINKILSVSKGRPIICALAFDWIMENPQQIDYITNLSESIFEQELVRMFKGLDKSEVDILKIMPYINKRLNPEIVKIILTNKNIDECTTLIVNLSRFSFVKYSEKEKSIILHDEIQKLIKNEFLIEHKDILFIYENLLKYYEDKQIPSLKIEKLYYLLRCDNPLVLEFLEQEFQYALDIYDYDFCALLIDEVNSCDDSCDNTNVIVNIIRLLKSKLLICQYKPIDAMHILSKLKESIEQSDNEKLYALILESMGECIINPCTMENADIFKAVELFKESYEILKREDFKVRKPYCLFGLGKAYVYIGQHAKANVAFSDAAKFAKENKNYRLMVKILDEKGKMLRLQQEVDESLKALQESFRAREQYELTNNRGVFYYYFANTHRDLNDFITANDNYIRAEQLLKEVDDKFALSELYCDWSWFEYLKDETNNFSSAEKYLSKAWELVQFYGFGTEFSEYYHIKYEMIVLLKNYELAYSLLDEALRYAYKYSNIYMILDCLNHDAQRAYRLNDFKRVQEILAEMIKYEKMGCGIKVFRGRTLLTNGDFFYKEKDYKSTYDNWIEGFCIVALYGNSRSNVELFEDLFNQRKEQFREILICLGESYKEKFKRAWKKKRISQEFDYVLQICE